MNSWILWAIGYFVIGFAMTIYQGFGLTRLFIRRNPMARSRSWSEVAEIILDKHGVVLVGCFLLWPLAALIEIVGLAVVAGVLLFNKIYKQKEQKEE